MKQKTLSVAALILTLATSVMGFAQAINVYNVNGVYNPAAYGAWKLYSASTVTATTATMNVIKTATGVIDPNTDCYVATLGPGSVRFTPLMANVRVTILDSNSETVTITSAVTTAGSCSFTATFGQAHNPGAIIVSADNGFSVMTALAPVGEIHGYTSELVTLSTSGATTDTAGTLLPANSILDMVQGAVNTTITGTCSGWQLGDASTAGRFSASDTVLTAGEVTPKTGIPPVFVTTGINSASTGVWQLAAAKVRITCATGAASAGKVRVTVFYHTYNPPTS